MTPLYFKVCCKRCAAEYRSRVFGELMRRPEEQGGGWGFRSKVRRRVSALPGRPRAELVTAFQTSGVVMLNCRSCPNKPTPTVKDLGRRAEAAEMGGVSDIYV